MRILVVDDSATMRRIVSNALRTIGYDDIVEAEDGEDALQTIIADEVELVVTDWNMPNMDGLDLVKALRRNTQFAHLPVLMVTSRGSKADVLEAMDANVNNYIVKPFTPPLLKEKISETLESA